MNCKLEIIATIISVASLIGSIYTYLATVAHDRKQATLDAFNTLQGEAFDNLNKLSPAEIRDILAHPRQRSDEYNALCGYVARIEHFCVGVNELIYDRRTVYQLAQGYLDGMKLRARIDPVIDKKNRSDEKDYYENIHKVLAWMSKKNKKKSVH